MHVSEKYGVIYVVTKNGLLFVYDLETATAIYRNKISNDPVFIACGAPSNGGIYAVNRRGQFARTHVGRGASIGANATIVCGHDIGAYAFIGAGAVVTKNVPAYALVVGNPARQMGWMSAFGHRLDFNEEGLATCPESGETYELVTGGDGTATVSKRVDHGNA